MFLESVECTKNFTNFMLLFRRYTPADPPEYEIKYFNQSLDHFNFENPGTFTQRYLITTKYWGGGKLTLTMLCSVTFPLPQYGRIFVG
eukprot:m.896915 g.896915  ORF g.896915 m.896915 type:complete len:88 (-) comp23669_c0_seq7:3635-3898(-)